MTKKGSISFVAYGKAHPNGSMVNPLWTQKPLSSIRAYDSLFVRHWDDYIKPERNTIFAGSISKGPKGIYSKAEVWNLLGAFQKNRLESPVGPLGGSSDFDLSPNGLGVAFVAKDPDINDAIWTSTHVYLVPHSGPGAPVPINAPTSPGNPPRRGASASPSFSPDSNTLVYLQQLENGYESDKFVGFSFAVPQDFVPSEPVKVDPGLEGWQLSPSTITWSRKPGIRLALVEENGRTKLWALSKPHSPAALTGAEQGSVAAVLPLSEDRLLITSSSFLSPTWYSIVDMTSNTTTAILPPERITRELEAFSKESVGEFWFDGAETKVRIMKLSLYLCLSVLMGISGARVDR